jgi:hypothetical protein
MTPRRVGLPHGSPYLLGTARPEQGEQPPDTASSIGAARRHEDPVLLAHGAWLLESETSLIASGHLDWNEQLIGDLLRRGADANFVPSNHGSLLHRVIYDGVLHILYPLILKGFADVDVRDTRGRTPLMVLATRAEGFCDMWSRTGIAELLLKHGADIHALDYRGRSMLHYAMCESTLEGVRFLLARGLDPNHQDATGTTPLIALLLHARHDIRGYVIEWLDMMLQTGADPFVRDHSGVSSAIAREQSVGSSVHPIEAAVLSPAAIAHCNREIQPSTSVSLSHLDHRAFACVPHQPQYVSPRPTRRRF